MPRLPSSPLLPRRAVLAGSLAAAAAGTASALPAPAAIPDPLPEAVRNAVALCWRANKAEWAEIRSEGEPGHAEASEATNALHFEIEVLRARTLAKLPKTLEDVAVLAVLAIYWERGAIEYLLKEADQPENPENILFGCGGRPLPSVFLALVEFLGLRLDLFPPDDDGPLSA